MIYYARPGQNIMPGSLDVSLSSVPQEPVLTQIQIKEQKLPTNRIHVPGLHVRLETREVQNFGHHFLDVLFPIWYSMEHFGVTTPEVRVLSNNLDTPFAERFWSAITHRPVLNWDKFLANKAKHAGSGSQVCFEHLIIGHGELSTIPRWGDYPYGVPNQYKPFFFRAPLIRQFSDYAIHTATGKEPVKILRHTSLPLVTVFKKTGRRNVTNFDSMLAVVRDYGSKNRIWETKVFRGPELTFRQQIELMQRTSVFVGQFSGGCFAAMFLPRNADFLTLGDPIFETLYASKAEVNRQFWYYGHQDSNIWWTNIVGINQQSYIFDNSPGETPLAVVLLKETENISFSGEKLAVLVQTAVVRVSATMELYDLPSA